VKINVMWILILLLCLYLPLTSDLQTGHRETLTGNDHLFLFAFTFTGRHLNLAYSLHTQAPPLPRPGFHTTLELHTHYSFSTPSNMLSVTNSSSNSIVPYCSLTDYPYVSFSLPVCKIYPATYPPDDLVSRKYSMIAPVPLPGNYMKIQTTCTEILNSLIYFAWNRAGGAVAPV